MSDPRPGPDRSRVLLRVATVLGLLLAGSALVVGPHTVSLWKGDAAVDFEDVFRRYALVAPCAGLVALACALLAGTSRPRQGLAVVVAFLALVAVADALLLAHLGLPLWMPDAETHYRHRPGVVRRTRARPDELWRINSHGFHDEEFPLEKPPGELRGLFVGDSVTQGYWLPYERTYPELVEDLLRERALEGVYSVQLINAGVAGYATEQEVITARRGLAFEPDFLVLGICLNDATEPYRVARELGGTGLDYHGVTQASSWLARTLWNETGVGRLAQRMRASALEVAARQQEETYNVRDMLADFEAPEYQEAWARILASLEEFYRLGEEAGIPALVVVFPYHIQCADPSQLGPQELLTRWARETGRPLLDVEPAICPELFPDPTWLAERHAAGATPFELLEERSAARDRVYIDSSHFTEVGHRLLAEAILAELDARGFLPPAAR